MKLRSGFCFSLLSLLCACKSVHTIERLPPDIYHVQIPHAVVTSPATTLAQVEQTDSLLEITPVSANLKPFQMRLNEINKLKLYRYTFDIDVLTVPFKIRPAVKGFPEQLNANFDAALYLGRRLDSYTIENTRKGKSKKTRISGIGYGYGGFVGIGSVTMNPYVTNQRIDYEYDGFVLNGGIAGIFDAKKFNLGLAVGADFLVDKNRRNWIYQGKPWVGVLFGINLN